MKNTNQNSNKITQIYQYCDKDGNKYNCRTGETGRFIELTDLNFMSENEISINTCDKIKEQDHFHVYKGATDYMQNKSIIFNIVGSITKLFGLL